MKLGSTPRRRMTVRWFAFVAAAALAVPIVPASAGTSQAKSGVLTTICYVPKKGSDTERTIKVPAATVKVVLNTSRSYLGACAAYGQSASLGNGKMTAYSQANGSVPTSIGVVFTGKMLTGLPTDPPTEGLWCYDKNADGTVDQHHECSGGYEEALHLNQKFKSTVDTPFTYVLTNWNAMGHIPPGVWDKPHFDVHFYLNENAERLAIRPGPCEVLVNCDDYKVGKILPAKKYLAPDYADVDALEPGMGNHLVDPTSPEFNGKPFTHTFLYGSWNGHTTFYEPMVTHDWYNGLRTGANADKCFPVKLPQAWERAGWYPTQYCLRYRANRDELTTSLEAFKYRAAT